MNRDDLQIALLEIEIPKGDHCFTGGNPYTFHCEYNNLFEGGSYRCELFRSYLDRSKKSGLPIKCSDCKKLTVKSQ